MQKEDTVEKRSLPRPEVYKAREELKGYLANDLGLGNLQENPGRYSASCIGTATEPQIFVQIHLRHEDNFAEDSLPAVWAGCPVEYELVPPVVNGKTR